MSLSRAEVGGAYHTRSRSGGCGSIACGTSQEALPPRSGLQSCEAITVDSRIRARRVTDYCAAPLPLSLLYGCVLPKSRCVLPVSADW